MTDHYAGNRTQSRGKVVQGKIHRRLWVIRLLSFIKPFYEVASVILFPFGNPLPQYYVFETLILKVVSYRVNRMFLILDEQYSMQFYKPHYNELMSFPFAESEERIPQILVIDNTGCQTSLDNITFDFKQKRFLTPPHIRELTEDALQSYIKYITSLPGLSYYNGLNLRVSNIKSNNGTVEIGCQIVEYNEYIRTNLCLDYKIKEDETLRDILHPRGHLDHLEESHLGNNFGINCLVVLSDGNLILQKRSKDVIVRPRELAPSFSGTIEPADIRWENSKLSEFDLFHEGLLEIGVSDKLIGPSIENVRFLGITRELVRGGQPELFFVCQINQKKADIIASWKTAQDRYEIDKLLFIPGGPEKSLGELDIHDIALIRKNITKFMKRYKGTVSLPLKANIALFCKYVEFSVRNTS